MSSVSDINRRKKFIINTAYTAIIVGLVFLAFRYLLGLIWPFFAAFLFAWSLHPVIRWLTVKCHVKYNLSVALCLIVFFAVLGGLIILLASRIATAIADFVVWLPSLYGSAVEPGLERLSGLVRDLANHISPAVYDMVNAALPNVISSIGSAVTSVSMKLVGALSGWATKLPSSLLSAVICVIATVFMTADFPRLTAFVLRQAPLRARLFIHEAQQSLKSIIKKYGKSYGIIMAVTFLEILVGLLILRQKNAVAIALAIAVFDIFPIVGAGLILVPWAIVALLGSSAGKGVGLLAIWTVEIIVRQVIEPRIVGRQVGLHPLVTLIAMFVGSKLFGGVGLLGLPIACATLQSLDEAGVIHIIRHENPPQPATPHTPSAPPDAATPIVAPPGKPGKKGAKK